MRIALVLVFVVVLCLGGYGVAFQHPAPVVGPRATIHRSSDQPGTRGQQPRITNVPYAPYPQVTPLPPEPVPGPETYPSYPPLRASGNGAPMNQQLAVLISKSGLRFLSPRVGLDVFDDPDLNADALLVLCDSAEVTTDQEGKPEVVCHGAAVIKAAGMGGKAGVLRYKAGCLVLEGDDSDSLLTRNKGDKTVFMLRARTINVNLNTQQIEASDGSVIQLKPEVKPVPVDDLPRAA